MNVNSKQVLIASLLSMTVMATTWAGEAATVGVNLDYVGKYIWRGQAATNDPVFEPAATLAYENLTLGIWGNLDTTNVNGQSGEFTEVDYSLNFSAPVPGVEKLGYSIGTIYYDFPEVPTNTQEVYVGLSYDTFLSPSATLYYDVDAVHGTYISAGIGHTVENIFSLGEGYSVNLDLAASLGWASGGYNSDYWGAPATSNGFNDLVLSAGLPVDLGHGLSLTPSITYVSLVDSDIRKTNAYAKDSEYLFAGISLAAEF